MKVRNVQMLEGFCRIRIKHRWLKINQETHHRIIIAKMLRTPRFRQLVIKNKKRYNRKRYKNESES